MKTLILIFLFSIFYSLSAEQKTKLEDKFENIQISGTQYFEAPLPEVLIELQRLSKQFDLTEANPLEKGVQFVYKSLGSDSPPKITLSLSPMSLKNSVRMICEMIGWHYHLAENRIIISKFSDDLGKNPLRNEFYEITQSSLRRMIGILPENAPPNLIYANDLRLKEYFLNNGITFNESKGHKFFLDGLFLTVTHDQENIYKIEEILRKNDANTVPHVCFGLLITKAPLYSFEQKAKTLKLPRETTINLPIVSTSITDRLINSLLEEKEVKPLYNLSLLAINGETADFISESEYFLSLNQEGFKNFNKTDSNSTKLKSRQVGLSVKLEPLISKWNGVEVDILSQFTCVIDRDTEGFPRRLPNFWSTKIDTKFIIYPNQTYIHISPCFTEGFELISFLSTEVKR